MKLMLTYINTSNHVIIDDKTTVNESECDVHSQPNDKNSALWKWVHVIDVY